VITKKILKTFAFIHPCAPKSKGCAPIHYFSAQSLARTSIQKGGGDHASDGHHMEATLEATSGVLGGSHGALPLERTKRWSGSSRLIPKSAVRRATGSKAWVCSKRWRAYRDLPD
jgi:hypothetical protein